MRKNNFGSFAMEDLDELENGVEQANATAEGAQATAEATAAELSQHENDAAAHGGAEATADEAAAAAAQAEADAQAAQAAATGTTGTEGADTTAADPEAAAAVAAADAAAAEAPASDSTTAVIEEAVAEADDVDAEVADTEAEAAVMDEATDRTDDVIAAVEEVEPENEDAPAEIAATVGLANESLKRLLGPRFNESLLVKMPSNESYTLKSTRTRQMYKNLAIESLTEAKDGFVQRMKDTIVKIWDWIKARLDKLVTWFRSSGKERAALLKRAEEAKITNRAVIENATLAQYLTISGQVEDTSSGLAKSLDDIGDLLKDYYKRVGDLMVGQAGKFMLGDEPAKNVLPKATAKKGLLGGWSYSVDAETPDGKDIEAALEAISNTRVNIVRDSAPAKNRVTTLNSADIVSLFRAADKFEKEVIDTPEAKRARSVTGKTFGALMARIQSSNSSKPEELRKLLRILSRLSALLVSPVSKLSAVGNSAVSTINLFAKVSLRAAKGESVEDELKGGSVVDEQAAAAKATNARPFDPKADRSFSARKAGAEDVSFKDVANENHSDTTVAGGDDPLDLNKDQNPGDADLNQSSQPAAEAPGKQDAKMKDTELDLPEEPQVTAALEAYEELTDAIEDGTDGLGLTERAITAAEGAQGKQGLDEAGAELMSIASEAIHKKFLNIDAVDLGFGLESFSRSAYKLKATGVSVESWKEKAKEIGQKIIEMVKQLGRMIRYVWKQFLTLFKGLEGKYERINRKLATTNEASMKNGKAFDSDSLTINGKAITPSVFNSAITAAVKLASDVAEDGLDLAEIASDQAQGKSADAARKVQQFAIGSKLAKNSDVKSSKEDGKTTYTFTELPGGRVANFVRPDMTDGIATGFSASIGKGEKKEAKVKTRNMDKSESKQVMQAVRKALDAMKKISSDVDAIAKSVDEIGSKLDPKALEGQGQADAARKAIGALGKAVMSDSKVAIQAIRMLSETGLNFVAKSIGMKGTEAAQAEPGMPGGAKALPAPAAA